MKNHDNLDNMKKILQHHMVQTKKKFDQDIFMASLLNRNIELEADRVVKEMRKENRFPNLLILLRSL